MKPRLRWRDYFGCVSHDELNAVRLSAYQVGLAEGELRGRLALSHELEAMFPEHRDGMTLADAHRIRFRQVH